MTEVERFLQYLNDAWERILDDPSCVPGSNFDEKVLNVVQPHVPAGVTCYLKGHYSLQYGRRFHILFVPEGSPRPPTDFDIRFA